MPRMPMLAACLILLLAGGDVAGETLTRLDGSSAARAESSFRRMSNELPESERPHLVAAMIAINLKDVGSAYELVQRPELQEPSITRIKDEVDGMTAAEIIEYAAEVSRVKTRIDGQ